MSTILSEEKIESLWHEAWNIAIKEAGLGWGNADVAHINQPYVFARLILEAQVEQCLREWQPIETAPKGRKVIVGYFNKCGSWRSVMARYYLPKTLQRGDDHDELDDDDEGYAPEGWYEEVESHETILQTDEIPTHWMPLPIPPKAAN